MKRLSLLVALMLAITIGGVYATWSYAGTDDIADAFAEAKVTITDAELTGANGTYKIEKIDEDYRIILTVKEHVIDNKTNKLAEADWYVIGNTNDGVDFLERITDDGTRYIKIDESFYYEVK